MWFRKSERDSQEPINGPSDTTMEIAQRRDWLGRLVTWPKGIAVRGIVIDCDDIGGEELTLDVIRRNRAAQVESLRKLQEYAKRITADEATLDAEVKAFVEGWDPYYWTDERLEAARRIGDENNG